MGRPSKLTDRQKADIERRLAAGEKPSDLAREYGVNRSAISRSFSQQTKAVKSVANQIVAAEIALKALPIAQQINATNLADQLRSISGHLAGAANFGAATAHRLAGIAHAKVQEIDDAAPLDEASMESLKVVAVLTRTSNEAGSLAIDLLKANKETVDDLNRGPEKRAPTGLMHFYGDNT